MTPLYAKIIEAVGARYVLAPQLVAAVVAVESDGNPWAIRYEPGFYDRYVQAAPIKAKAPCSNDTERRLRAMSFGLMQIMGQTARERGFVGTYLSQLCDPEAGIEYGCKHLSWLASRYLDAYGWEGVIAAYNAGSPRRDGPRWGNQGYVDKIRAAGGFGP